VSGVASGIDLIQRFFQTGLVRRTVKRIIACDNIKGDTAFTDCYLTFLP
jgi:hypothetical protein